MNTHEHLKVAAQVGDVDELYKLITNDPNIMSIYEAIRFCETPLHVAAEAGQNKFALEIMAIMPSLATKLNVSGYSAIHLALHKKENRTVRALVAVDSGLVRVKGRGSTTPLHYAAQTGDDELLSEFLMACPSSVNDLTAKCETVAHLAVKSHQVRTFKVLLGWLKRVQREDILDWKNDDGNTVLHIAASINQIEVINLLSKSKAVKVAAKNLNGKTARDIQNMYPPPSVSNARRFLQAAKDRFISHSTTTLSDYLSKDLSFIEKRNNLLGISNLTKTRDKFRQSSNLRDATIVVGILIMTVTYQAYFSPPGGFWQETDYNATPDHVAGRMIMRFRDAFFFLGLNGFAFLIALSIIIILVIGLPMWNLVYGATAVLGVAMLASHWTIFPDPDGYGLSEYISMVVFIIAFPLLIGLILLAAFMAFISDKRRRQRVDFPASCFSSNYEL